jgi:hypothetical protein
MWSNVKKSRILREISPDSSKPEYQAFPIQMSKAIDIASRKETMVAVVHKLKS